MWADKDDGGRVAAPTILLNTLLAEAGKMERLELIVMFVSSMVLIMEHDVIVVK